MKKLLHLGIVLAGLSMYAQNDGSLDANFGTAGKVITSINSGADKAYSVALQSDGKIVVAGMTTNTATGKDFACVRYNTDGTLDQTFATAGIFTNDVQLGSDDVAYSLAIQADGKIILAGYSDDGSNKNAALIRLNADGTIDTTFGTSGKVLTDFITNKADEIKVVKIHSLTGNIIVGGTSATSATVSQAVIARYTSTGTLDTTFSTTGINNTLLNSSGGGTYSFIIEDLSVKTNGKISAVGWINQQGLQWSANHYACRLNNNGVLDTTFSSNGVIATNGGFNADDKSFSMILNADDSILFSGGGHLTTLEYDYFMGLYDASGASAVGKASFDFGVLIKDIAYGMGMDSTGRIVLAGSNVSSITNSTFGISRVNANYTVDTTFGTSGKVTTTFGTNTANEAFDMAIQSDDKIVAVGYTGNDFAIARYNGNSLSVNEFEKNNAISIYPNPAKNNLKVSLLNKNLLNNGYQIIDINGRIISEGSIKNDVSEINISDLSKGIYFLKIKNLNITKKFIKN